MGSRGSGSFTDYAGSTKKKDDGQGGGGMADDRCGKAFGVILQDVEHCAFFKKYRAVPKKGTPLQIAQIKRIVAIADTGEVVGNLPTKMNYLAACLEAGFSYTGHVRESSEGSVASVAADFAPNIPK